MGNKEKFLSEYIDTLNAEKKPGEKTQTKEMEELYAMVRIVRRLKEPALPESDYPGKLALAVASRLSGKSGPVPGKAQRKKARPGLLIGAAAAAMLVLAFLLNFALHFNGNGNIVYAMDHAFREIKAYHGILEIMESNAEEKTSIQAKLEIWADKEGRYYVHVLEGGQKGLITVNNGQKKWQVRPDQKQVHVFPAFPDPYRFVFELGKEIEGVKNALETKIVGEDTMSGRKATVLEVTPRGGVPYRLWIDKENNLPIRKESGMQNGIKYKAVYTSIDFSGDIPVELVTYKLPAGFEEVNEKTEQLVSGLEEAGTITGLAAVMPVEVPEGYRIESIAVETSLKRVRINFTTGNGGNKVIVLESKAAGGFKPDSTAVLGKIGNSDAEILSPVQESPGIPGVGPYAGVTDINSVRWQQDGIEYAVIGNVPLEELALFIKGLAKADLEITEKKPQDKPQVKVNVDMETEENEQKSVDAGHSPWRLDPVYVAQVFVSLKISPEGITGEYPVKYEELKVTQNDGIEAVIEVTLDDAPVRRVYLKRLVRQDSTGIWTVVGYDSADR